MYAPVGDVCIANHQRVAPNIEEGRQSVDVVVTGRSLRDCVPAGGRRRRRRLGTDGPVAQRHADTVPFLRRASRRHEAKIAIKKRRILQTEVGLDKWQAPVARMSNNNK